MAVLAVDFSRIRLVVCSCRIIITYITHLQRNIVTLITYIYNVLFTVSSNVIVTILSQPNDYHADQALNLKNNILKQAKSIQVSTAVTPDRPSFGFVPSSYTSPVKRFG